MSSGRTSRLLPLRCRTTHHSPVSVRQVEAASLPASLYTERMIDAASIDWANVPVRWKKPTTRWGRSVRRRFWHEPVTASRCTCGDEFSNADDHLRHQRAFGSVWSRVRFAKKEGGAKVARPLAGHALRFTPSPERGWSALRCRCGWSSASKRLRRPGPAAREHVRETIRRRLGLDAVGG